MCVKMQVSAPPNAEAPCPALKFPVKPRDCNQSSQSQLTLTLQNHHAGVAPRHRDKPSMSRNSRKFVDAEDGAQCTALNEMCSHKKMEARCSRLPSVLFFSHTHTTRCVQTPSLMGRGICRRNRLRNRQQLQCFQGQLVSLRVSRSGSGSWRDLGMAGAASGRPTVKVGGATLLCLRDKDGR